MYAWHFPTWGGDRTGSPKRQIISMLVNRNSLIAPPLLCGVLIIPQLPRHQADQVLKLQQDVQKLTAALVSEKSVIQQLVAENADLKRKVEAEERSRASTPTSQILELQLELEEAVGPKHVSQAEAAQGSAAEPTQEPCGTATSQPAGEKRVVAPCRETDTAARASAPPIKFMATAAAGPAAPPLQWPCVTGVSEGVAEKNAAVIAPALPIKFMPPAAVPCAAPAVVAGLPCSMPVVRGPEEPALPASPNAPPLLRKGRRGGTSTPECCSLM